MRHVKVIFAGDGAVGKTAVVNRFTRGEYGANYKMTIGTNISVHKSVKNGIEVTLVCWDLGGQPRFEAVRGSFYLGAQVIVLVYDVTSSGSFKNLANWLEEVNRAISESNYEGYKGIIIGNKVDLPAEFRAVDIDEAKSFAEAIGFMYLETSAKDGNGITDLVEMLVDSAFVQPSQELVELDTLS
ncbi:Rab family GTPase [Candidatus Borrarchaeum sp.]|uniref:Rab family GTPase n=1 Tax=Candidatus Borrarchaeum sp. TaxID=2846742 RepID=UPI00257DF125|nr:Rab family GTPase [Candidatus Borrarchaeum sp.]